jgi:hypothetical protein
MKKVKFVPFALKADIKTKEVFTNMSVYNSLENNKKAYTQIIGASRNHMDAGSTQLTDSRSSNYYS